MCLEGFGGVGNGAADVNCTKGQGEWLSCFRKFSLAAEKDGCFLGGGDGLLKKKKERGGKRAKE